MSNRQRQRASSRSPRTNAPPRVPEPSGLAAPPNPRRIPLYAGLAVLGAAVGLSRHPRPGGPVPGRVAARARSVGGTVPRRPGADPDTARRAGLAAVGWFIAVIVLLGGRPEGDYVFGEEIGLALFMLGGMAVAVICATMSRLPYSANDTGRSGS